MIALKCWNDTGKQKDNTMIRQISGFFHNARMTSVWKIVAILIGFLLLYSYSSYLVEDHIAKDHSLRFLDEQSKKEVLQKPNKYQPHLIITSVCFVAAITGFFVVKTNKTKVTLRKEKDGTYIDITGFVFNVHDLRIHKCIAYIITRSFPFSPKSMLVVELVTGKGNYLICESSKDFEKYDLTMMGNNILTKQLLSVKYGTVLNMARFLGIMG